MDKQTILIYLAIIIICVMIVNIILNLRKPIGVKGDQGPIGLTGAKGDQGPIGPSGVGSSTPKILQTAPISPLIIEVPHATITLLPFPPQFTINTFSNEVIVNDGGSISFSATGIYKISWILGFLPSQTNSVINSNLVLNGTSFLRNSGVGTRTNSNLSDLSTTILQNTYLFEVTNPSDKYSVSLYQTNSSQSKQNIDLSLFRTIIERLS